MMGRVPEPTRQEFMEFAKEEFCDDYGMAFKFCFEQALEYQQMKKALFEGQINTEKNPVLQDEEKSESVTMLSGRKVKGGKKE